MMPTLNFKDYKTLAERIDFIYRNEIKGNEEITTPSFDVIGLYREAKIVVSELIKLGYNIALCADFEKPSFNEYKSEYVVGIYDDELWIEPMYRDDKLVSVDSFMTYVFGNCNSKILKGIHADFICDISVGGKETSNTEKPDEPDKTCKCDKCVNKKSAISSSNADNNNTKVKAKCTYKVNGKEVDKSTYDAARETMKRYDNVDEKFVDLLKDMLLFQCSYRDRYNELLKTLW